MNQVRSRVGDFLYEIEDNLKDKNVLIIAHGAVLWMLNAICFGMTPNEAVNFILDDLVKAFEVYDVQWLESELMLKQNLLGELEQQQAKQSVKQANVELVGVRRKPRTTFTSKEIEELKEELNSLKQILKSKYPSKEMEKSKYKMPYSGGYIAETIIHELRNQPEILQEILLNAG